jgi:hypothetical protein
VKSGVEASAPAPIPASVEDILTNGDRETGYRPLVVPDLAGKALADAVLELKDAGMVPRVMGNGRVYSQEPKAGAEARRGEICTVMLRQDGRAR